MNLDWNIFTALSTFVPALHFANPYNFLHRILQQQSATGQTSQFSLHYFTWRRERDFILLLIFFQELYLLRTLASSFILSNLLHFILFIFDSLVCWYFFHLFSSFPTPYFRTVSYLLIFVNILLHLLFLLATYALDLVSCFSYFSYSFLTIFLFHLFCDTTSSISRHPAPNPPCLLPSSSSITSSFSYWPSFIITPLPSIIPLLLITPLHRHFFPPVLPPPSPPRLLLLFLSIFSPSFSLFSFILLSKILYPILSSPTHSNPILFPLLPPLFWSLLYCIFSTGVRSLLPSPRYKHLRSYPSPLLSYSAHQILFSW